MALYRLVGVSYPVSRMCEASFSISYMLLLCLFPYASYSDIEYAIIDLCFSFNRDLSSNGLTGTIPTQLFSVPMFKY